MKEKKTEKTKIVFPVVITKASREQIGDGFNLARNLSVKLVEVVCREGKCSVVKDQAGKTALIDLKNTDYAERANINTAYNLHPEEILADNFMLLIKRILDPKSVKLDHPELLDSIQKVFATEDKATQTDS